VEIEAIAQRVVERSSGPFHEATRMDLEELIRAAEAIRERLMSDAGTT
jgi:hypothetical protein